MSILDSVGNTPIVRLDNINPNPKVKLYAKLEGANPGGAAMWVALEMAKELNDGTIVVILPDRGDRYLSTALFTSVCAQCPP
jgi:cysteine synthase